MFIIHIYILELILFFFLNSFLNINVRDLTRQTKPHKKKADAIGLLAKEKREKEKRNGSWIGPCFLKYDLNSYIFLFWGGRRRENSSTWNKTHLASKPTTHQLVSSSKPIKITSFDDNELLAINQQKTYSALFILN